ncbi:hypothetical protein BDR06DRAFT_619423 [Suillus hirtellus]|nr:hypothetical protein BDR06DRAFT_619423 [Suillus hirtellus]
MALSLKLMRKRLQLWNVRTATRPTVPLNQVNQQVHNHLKRWQGHKGLKHDRQKRTNQPVGGEMLPTKSPAADFTLVVVPLHVNHKIIKKFCSLNVSLPFHVFTH